MGRGEGGIVNGVWEEVKVKVKVYDDDEGRIVDDLWEEVRVKVRMYNSNE